MANQFYSVNKTIRGKEYTAQFNGISAFLDAIDDSYIDGTDTTSLLKLAKHLFNDVIVSPKISVDDFGADKIGVEQTKEINGVTYKGAFKGMSVALKAIDESYIDGKSNTSIKKLANFLFANIITTPEKLTPDSFDSLEEFNDVVAFARDIMQGGEAMDEFNEVVTFAREVMQGHFRKTADDDAAKKKGK